MRESRIYGEEETTALLDSFLDELCDVYGAGDWALVGIHRRGDLVAERLRQRIQARRDVRVDLGVLDITLYRDDFHPDRPQPMVRPSRIPFSIDGTSILLIDDVLFTGRTVRAALNQLADFGRPRRVVLAVVIDRRMRELPICPDHVGAVVERPGEELVQLRLREIDDRDEVLASRPEGGS